MQVRIITSLLAFVCASAMTAHAQLAAPIVAQVANPVLVRVGRVSESIPAGAVQHAVLDLADPSGLETPDSIRRLLQLTPAQLDVLEALRGL
ncbi:hypothetical protein BKA70DRAFT_1480075 [Coprinopsis sp. MPI-PUGE-AT-0042]|nr:hypothetical protein BKA70DRAFT_1480075 [Coprinopsis sp. MPI-PUGE-AT-0042]